MIGRSNRRRQNCPSSADRRGKLPQRRAGWLSSRLKWQRETCCSGSGHTRGVSLFSESATLAISTSIRDSGLSAPCATLENGHSLSWRIVLYRFKGWSRKARLFVRKGSSFIVDDMQLVSTQAKEEKERLTKVSNALRSLAKDTGVPVVAISQLSRPKDGNQNFRPNKFHLKESGTVENDSHVIIMTYRPVDQVGDPTGEDELIIRKAAARPSEQRTGLSSTQRH